MFPLPLAVSSDALVIAESGFGNSLCCSLLSNFLTRLKESHGMRLTFEPSKHASESLGGFRYDDSTAK